MWKLVEDLKTALKYERDGWTNAMQGIPVRDLDERTTRVDSIIARIEEKSTKEGAI